MKHISHVLVFWCWSGLSILLHGQNLSFDKLIVGPERETPAALLRTQDGGYLLVGSTESYGANTPASANNSNGYLVRLNDEGDTLWTRTLGDATGYSFRDAVPTSDGGWLVLGYYVGDEIFDILLHRITANGDIVKTKRIGIDGHYEIPYVIRALNDDEFIIVGRRGPFPPGANGSALVLKVNEEGEVLWHKEFSGADYRFFPSHAAITAEGGCLIIGTAYPETVIAPLLNSKQVLLKIDSDGNYEWDHTYRSDLGWFHGLRVEATGDGNYIIAGARLGVMYIAKIDGAGDILWQRGYAYGEYLFARSLCVHSDGSCVISASVSLDELAVVLFLDPNGNMLAQRSFRRESTSVGAGPIVHNDDGGHTQALTTEFPLSPWDTDIRLVRSYGDDLGIGTYCSDSVSQVVDSLPLIVPFSQTVQQDFSPVLDEIAVEPPIGSGGVLSTLCINVGAREYPNSSLGRLLVVPNPSSTNFELLLSDAPTNATVEFYDTQGRMLERSLWPAQKRVVHMDWGSLSAGCYHIRVVEENGHSRHAIAVRE